jgi:hypothetical protein
MQHSKRERRKKNSPLQERLLGLHGGEAGERAVHRYELVGCPFLRHLSYLAKGERLALLLLLLQVTSSRKDPILKAGYRTY